MTVRPDLDRLREQASQCHACPLWKDATQTVFGEGPLTARIMLVGEQPGDKEDLAGRPFVGPAGQVLDRALEQAGLDRGSSTSPTRSSISNFFRVENSACIRSPSRPRSGHVGRGTSRNWPR